MKISSVCVGMSVLALFALSAVSSRTQTVFSTQSTEPQQPALPSPQEKTETQPQVQMRGPLHESFASPFSSGPLDPLIVPKQPPPPLDEEPAKVVPSNGTQQPQWIPGYWTFEEGQWIWVSGTWRFPPPQRRWVPGSWEQTEAGWQWSPGFWAKAGTGEMQYLPPPPAPREIAPTVAAPQPGCFWVPGCWLCDAGRYHWRAGYWARSRADFVWVPARYYRTPRGYVYADGYWDRPPDERGLLFAPVVCAAHRPVHYRPSVVLQFDSLFVHLFARPRTGHYCFGNYYDAIRPGRDCYSWVSFGRSRTHYDPMMIWFQVNRGNYVRNVAQRHHHHVQNRSLRPAQSWAAYRAQAARNNSGAALGLSVRVALNNNKSKRFRRASPQQLQNAVGSKRLYETLRKERNKGVGKNRGKLPQQKKTRKKTASSNNRAKTKTPSAGASKKKTGSAVRNQPGQQRPVIRPTPTPTVPRKKSKSTSNNKRSGTTRFQPSTNRPTVRKIALPTQPKKKASSGKRKSSTTKRSPRTPNRPKVQRSIPGTFPKRTTTPPPRKRITPQRPPVQRTFPKTAPKRSAPSRPRIQNPIKQYRPKPAPPKRSTSVRGQPRSRQQPPSARRPAPRRPAARPSRSSNRSRQSSRRRK